MTYHWFRIACLLFDNECGIIVCWGPAETEFCLFLCVIILLNCLPGLFRVGMSLASAYWTMWCFAPAWGVMLVGAAAGMGEPHAFMGAAGQLPGFPWFTSLEAFHYFVESVVSSTFLHPSISIPGHWCRLKDALIIHHFWLSALKSLVYTETYANTLLS